MKTMNGNISDVGKCNLFVVISVQRYNRNGKTRVELFLYL